MKNRYAVMGDPVEHSLSPLIHQLFARQMNCELVYEKIQIDLSCFEHQVHQFFDEGGLGLNITLPCKQRAFNLADHVTDRCMKAKAANTLWQNSDGIQADNTDGIGLIRDLSRYMDLADRHILIVGAGGAARGIMAPLLAANPSQITVANRTMESAQALCNDFIPAKWCSLPELTGTFDLIINATSASLSNQKPALSSSLITPMTVCYDLGYNQQAATPFVAWAQSHGCVGIDGLGMLVEQAAETFYIWHGAMPDTAPVLADLRNRGCAIL